MAVKLNKTAITMLLVMRKNGKSVTEIAKRLSVTRQTVYNYIDPEKNRSKISERNKKGFNPYSPGFSIYLVYLLDILIRSISSKLFDT